MWTLVAVVLVVMSLSFVTAAVGGAVEARLHRGRLRDEAARLGDVRLRSDGREKGEMLVQASIVVAPDPFRRGWANFVRLFGGRIDVWAELAARARQDAELRVRAHARRAGYREVVALRFDQTTLQHGRGENAFIALSVCAYGTARDRAA